MCNKIGKQIPVIGTEWPPFWSAFVPYIELDYLSDLDIRKFRLADNRVSQDTEWDKNLLRNELAELELNSELEAEWWKATGSVWVTLC